MSTTHSDDELLNIVVNIRKRDREREHYAKSELKELGFTETMINKLLPEPILVTNPKFKCTAPMKLWLRSDIHKIMESDEYKKERDKAKKRQKSAQKAVETKTSKLREQMLGEISKIKVTLFSGDDKDLRNLVIREKQDWYNSFEYYCESSAYSADDATVDRWVVNYIRHNLTEYDYTLYDARGKTGIGVLYPEYRNAILEKIADVYPKYTDECKRQMYKIV